MKKVGLIIGEREVALDGAQRLDLKKKIFPNSQFRNAGESIVRRTHALQMARRGNPLQFNGCLPGALQDCTL